MSWLKLQGKDTALRILGSEIAAYWRSPNDDMTIVLLKGSGHTTGILVLETPEEIERMLETPLMQHSSARG